ncbi:kinase-like domain-containing protein [Trichophaea hybrida]|nr:kinase-like domain-containing protein [Trichophaea hybrida]
MSALLETWVKTTYRNASRANQNRLFQQFVYHMRALGVNFGETTSDAFAEARKHYLASAEQLGKQLLRENQWNSQPSSMENTVVRARGSLAWLGEVKRTSTLQAQDPGFLRPTIPIYIRPSILKEDYIEYEKLGKGAFGVVTKVVHKLDRSEYALKKVRLTTTSLRLNGRGDAVLGWRRILTEVRTLAKLDHINIVRYYSSWIEDGNVVHTPIAVPESDNSKEKSTDADCDRPVDPSFPKGWPNVIYDPDEEVLSPRPPPRRIMDLDKPSIPDHQIAIIDEDKEGALVSQTPSRFSVPDKLTLHIVMALYDMSLKDFIVKRMDQEKGRTPAVQHCYCPRASLEILQTMVNGVDYLHKNGIIHRDLKPANVMLHIPDKSQRATCCEKGGFVVIPKIADFGIIENFDPRNPKVKVSTEKQNGTTWYMPPEPGNHPKVDVWALGIMLVELLYQFGTASEQAIWFSRFNANDTRRGRWPREIASDKHGLLKIIEGCCHIDPELRWSILQLKQQVKEALRRYEGSSSTDEREVKKV